MRLSDFQRMITEEFGEAAGEHLMLTMALTECNGLTATEALDAGFEPKTVWLALCRAKDVPESRWLGRDLPLRDTPWNG